MAKPKLIKVCLMNQGLDQETPWAHDLGPARGPKGSRKARLINVPFLHAKPTWGDVVVVSPVEDGFPTWDRQGVAWTKIGTRIAEDGGRWAMIVDYAPNGKGDAFGALVRACAEHNIVCEGAVGPRNGRPGRSYLAVRNELTDVNVMSLLRTAALPCKLFQIHPKPASGTMPKRATRRSVRTTKSRP